MSMKWQKKKKRLVTSSLKFYNLKFFVKYKLQYYRI